MDKVLALEAYYICHNLKEYDGDILPYEHSVAIAPPRPRRNCHRDCNSMGNGVVDAP